MYRPKLGPVGSGILEVFVDVLELTSITLGFYAIMHTSSEPLIESEDNPTRENELMVNLAIATRSYVIAAMALFIVVFLMRSVVFRFIDMS